MSQGIVTSLALAAMALEMNRNQFEGLEREAARNEQLSQQHWADGRRRRGGVEKRNAQKQRKGRKMKTSTNARMKF